MNADDVIKLMEWMKSGPLGENVQSIDTITLHPNIGVAVVSVERKDNGTNHSIVMRKSQGEWMFVTTRAY